MLKIFFSTNLCQSAGAFNSVMIFVLPIPKARATKLLQKSPRSATGSMLKADFTSSTNLFIINKSSNKFNSTIQSSSVFTISVIESSGLP